MARPIVKYLDPISGEYEFATVVDVGDLRNLNTTIKSDIVGAINSIISDGVHNPINNEKIEDLERIINSLKDGTFKIDDFGSIDEYLKQQFLDELDNINEKNREEIQSVLTQLDTSVDDAIKDYQEKVAAQSIILENAENTLSDARDTLEAKAAELETANIGLSEIRTEFDELDNYISTSVRTIDFDNFNAMVEDYETVVTQTSDEVGVDMSGSTLSYLTGRVTDAEANISAQADEITSKMSYDEFQYMPVPKYSYGENLLFNTFDFGDAWNGKNGAQVTTDTFLFGKVVAFNSPTGLYETLTDDLTIGESYVFSTYVNVQPSEKSPSQDKYGPISKSYDPTDFKIQIGGKSFNPGVYEDLSGINGWVRINQEFVADAVNPIISITPTGVNSQNEVAYMAMPKVEKGLTVTPWQPHVEDNYATLSSTQSMIKQQANSITAFVTEVSELDDSYKQATSTFQMLADGFKANTEAVEAYEDAVTRYGTEYSNINGKFEQKVWKDDFKTVIEDINIDNRNRVLNSDFIRSEISSSDRRLIVEDWSLNADWEIKTIDNNEYLSRNRTGLTQNLITSASSNYFPVRDGERILFGFDLIHSGLDDDKVFAIELFDINNKRLLKQEFSLSSLTKVGNRYHGSFSISTPGAEKGSVVLQLPRNGSVSFTKVSFQNADIGSVDWSPAPEDSWIIQSKLATYISQVEDEITIGGVGQKIDTLTGLLTEDKGTFTLNPDKIATEVLNSQTYDDMGFVNKTNFEQTADGWVQEITSEGRLAGYINASPDTYRISFDKIMLEGTTWADALGSSKITVTENFALLGKNGRPVLDVNNDGSINMNITSLKIGEYNALTTDDKSDIEKEVADNVIKTTEPYIHIAYADTEDGEGLSFNPSGKQYIGFAKSHLPKPSGTASNYEWSKYVGADGYEGTDGVGIESTTVWYASSDSGTNQPTAGWSSKIPTVEPGNYLWTEVVWKYTNNEKKQSYTVARIGADGADGKDGVVGKDGVGIKSTTITYGVSPNETTQPATYTSTVPTLVKGQYLWTKTVWVYTDSTTETGYTKTYIPKDGNDGTNGIAGKDGVGISKTTITYAKSTNGTTAPTTGYTTTVPSANPGEFVWTKTVWTYTDNTTETGYSVGKIGNTGATGANGKDGIAGKDGVGIIGTNVNYATSTNGTIRPNSWGDEVPTTQPGDYLWTKTTWYYSDNTSENGYTVSRIGKDGNTGKDGLAGKDGVGITDTVITYAKSTSGITPPGTGWNSAIPTVAKGEYLWTRTVWDYSDNTSETGYSVARMGLDGNSGKDGNPGKDGVGLKTTVVEYTISTSATTAPTSGYKTVVPTLVKGQYLWTRTTWTYSDNSTETGYSVSYIAKDGNNGTNGIPGKDGVGITNTVIQYAKSASGTTAPTSGWVSTPPSANPGEFVWTKTTWTYTDNTTEVGYSVGRIGTNGTSGKDGAPGKDGVGITDTVVEYGSSTSGITKPTTWTTTVPTVAPGNYQWTRTTWVYTDGTSEIGYTNGRIGKDGNNGTNGLAGKDGVGIKSTVINYATSSSGTTKPTSGWTSTVPSVTPGNYLWTRTVWTYTDNDTEEGYSVSRIGKDGTNGTNGTNGKDGTNGTNGTGIKSAVISYVIHTNGTTTPTLGWVSTVPNPVKGNYMWTRTITTYTDNTTSTTYSVAYQATDGQKGDKGTDGTGVSSTAVTYAQTTSGTTTPTSWSGTRPAPIKGQYLWSRTIITYTNGSSSTAYNTSYSATDGQKGDKGDTGPEGPRGATGSQGPRGNTGTSVESITEYYLATSVSSGILSTNTGFKTTMQPLTATNKYLWNYEKINFSDGTSQPTIPVIIGVYGDKGQTGATGATGASGKDGVAGKDGKGISSTAITYMTSTSGTTAPTTGWTATVPSLTKGQYLWTRTIWTYTDTTTETGYSVSYIAKDGNNGTNGVAGKDGVGITSTSITYTGSTSGTVTPTSGWATTVPTVAAGSFLWTRTIWTYTDTTTETGYSVARMGSNGAKGGTGATGATGRSIVSITEHYLATSASSGVTRTTSGWGTTMQPTTETNKYLWNYETITWSSGTITTYVEPIIIGVHGAKGAQGAQGVSITKVDVQYYLSTSNTSQAGGSWSTTAPAWIDGRYMWSKTVTTYTSGTPTESKPVCITGAKGSTGATGGTGATGRGVSTIVEQFYLSTSKATQTGGSWSTTMPTWSPGKYVWTRSLITYTTGTPATSTTEPLVSSEWEAINELEIGGTNLLQNSRTVSISSNNNATYPASVTAMEEDNRKFSRIKRTDLTLTPTTFSIYSTIPIANINKSIFDNESTVVSFKARASQNVTMSTMQTTYGGSPVVTGNLGSINVTTEWKTFYSIFPKIPTSASGFRVNPTANTTSVNMSTFYLDLCEWKIEKGNKATDWTPAPEDVAASIKVAQDKANAASQEAIAAQADATVGKNMADNLSNDSIITQVEKLELKREWDAIVKEKPSITIQATDYALQGSTEATNYNAAYTALNGSIPSLLTNMKVTSTVARATFNNNFANYYDRRQLLLNRIAKKAKELADVAQSSIDNLEIGGRNLIINKDIVTGIYLQNQNGVTASASTHATTGFIPVTPSSNYTLSTSPPKNLTQMRVVYYTSAKVYISGILYSGNQGSIKQITTPSNAAFVRWSGDNATSSKLTEWMFEKGNKASSWTPSPEDIEASYTAVAQAKAEAERVKAQTYADGKVSDEEKARIKDADAKLAAAKKYAVDQILSDKTIKDTRNDNQAPSWYYTNHPRRTIKEFKLTATIGVVSSEGTYGILETEIPWNDASGGPVKQTFRVNSKTFKRSGTTTSWSSWVSYDDMAETAKSDAATAKGIADGAASSASTANSLLADIASDSVLTPGEKKNTKKEWDIIVGEKPKIDASADTYGITTQKTAYNNAYNALNTYLTGSGGLLVNLNTKSTIVGTTFRNNFKNYYNARQDLLNAISNGAKQHAENISKVQDIGNGNKKFINVGGLVTQTSSIKGYLVIKTPLTSAYMTKMKISGYNYVTRKTNIDMTVSFYAYSNNTFHQYGFISNGDYSYDKVQLARDSSGKTVVIIGNQSDAYSYPIVSIDEVLVTYGTPPDSFKNGFSAEIVTDISMYTNIVNVPGGDTKLNISAAQTAANNAATAASNAQSTATAANNSASTANSLLTDIASDSKLTATEKKAAKKEWDIIVGEKPKIDTSANTYGIITEKTAYNTAYSTLNNYLSSLLANLNTTSNIVGTTFRSNFRAYYNARQDLLNKIADSAKSLVDGIEIGGVNMIVNSNKFDYSTTGTNISTNILTNVTEPLVVGKEYTFSFDIKATANGKSNRIFINNSMTIYKDFNFTSEWTRHFVTFVYNGGNYSGRQIYPHLYPDMTGTKYIRNVKLETGNKATGWTLAPEDVALDVNKKTYNPVRYIRDWSNGSTANNGNHWYELMAIDEHGNNRALNRTVTSNGTGSSLPHLTNGVTAIGTYVSATNSEGAVYLQVDLGQIYYNIVEIKVWKYYNDGRTYKENKTEVSSDGVTWYPIYDYTVEGEYTPTAEGKSIPNTIAKTHSILTGSGTKNLIDLKANAERIKAEAYADGKVSAEEKKRIAEAEDKYRKALILSRASSGKLMNSDPNFSKNLNEFTVYNNSANGNVVVLHEDAASSTGPSGVTRRLRVTTTGTASPHWGGVVTTPALMSRANAEYVIRFTALLPKGKSFNYAQNAMGTGYTAEWLTSTAGTGAWEEYIYYYKCGSTGSFSSFGHLYALGGTAPTTASPLIWYIDKYEALDISNVTGNPSQEDVDGKASAEDLINAENGLSTSIGDLSNIVDGKVDKSLYEEFLEHNANIQEQLSISTTNAQEDITKALARTATVEQKLGDGAADWIFTHTQIRMSDEGITLGEQGSGSYLQITNDQISFYNGSVDPVAFINGGMLNINHAIFVESIQISEFMFSSEAPGHLTLRYVGK